MKVYSFLLCTTLIVSGQSIAQSTTASDLQGGWKSVACELRPQTNQDGSVGNWWLTREIRFTEDTIEAEFTTYGDAGCKTPLNVLSFGGDVELGEPSSVIDGAVEAVLTIDHYVAFTPLAEGFADFLNSAPKGTCGTETWSVGARQEILAIGCSVLGLEPNKPTTEYELLSVVDNHLYFAARPTDGSFMTSPDKRVLALQVPLRREQ